MYYLEFYVDSQSSCKFTMACPASDTASAKKFVEQKYPGHRITITRVDPSQKPSWFKG
ncbi:MAG: hypothetical protein MJZ22_02710 [Candidatus Saccharibacteria bacterium]|nr:hypothetical protein [Candidatus Saccharibacteria bacterium]